MASVGEKLRRARLDKGLDIAAVSIQTKIGQKFLEAIEDDDRERIPGGFFYRSWVHQYARAVSLDQESITADLEHLFGTDQPLPLPGQGTGISRDMLPPPIPMAKRGGGANRLVNSTLLLLIVVFTCSGFYTWWHRTQLIEASSIARESAAPAVDEKAVTPATASRPIAAPPESHTAAGQTAPDANAGVQIEISATEQTWLSVSPDGKQLFSGVMHPAEVKLVAARETARLRVGNAGGLVVKINGKLIGPIGSEGQVRTVILTKDGAQVIDPKPTAQANDPAQPLESRAPVSPAFQQ